MLSQQYNSAFHLTVNDIVLTGRYPYFQTVATANDFAICKKAMEIMNVEDLRDRDYNTLSGGGAQKVQIAVCLHKSGKPA